MTRRHARPTPDALGLTPDRLVGAKVKTVDPRLFGTPRRNKYRAVPTVHAGVRYDSKAEAERAAVLDQLQASGEILWWLGQPKFRLGCPENVYKSDFLVITPSGVHVEDTKGVETPKFRRDKNLWAAYGPCELHVIKRGKVVEVIEGGGARG